MRGRSNNHPMKEAIEEAIQFHPMKEAIEEAIQMHLEIHCLEKPTRYHRLETLSQKMRGLQKIMLYKMDLHKVVVLAVVIHNHRQEAAVALICRSLVGKEWVLVVQVPPAASIQFFG